MLNSQTPDNKEALTTPNGADNGAWRSRVADLLDDVTVVTALPTTASPADEAAAPVGTSSPQPAPVAPWADAPLPPDPYEPPAWAIREVPPAQVALPLSEQAPEPAAVLSQAAAGEPLRAESPERLPDAEPPRIQATNLQSLSIRGRGDGLAVEIGKGVWAEIMAALAERLEQSAGFFRNARIALDVGPRPVLEDEMQTLLKLIERYDMSIGAVRTSAERTFQSALALGLTVTLESADGAPVAAAAPAAANVTTAAYFVYRGYLRSGHRLKRTEHILVIGDVNPGAEVVSDGDILVWGRLRGVAHAGASGNRRAIVAALDLEPTQLRIADVATIGPDPQMGQPGKWFWQRSRTKRPEIARIANQVILLDEWDATRPGGLVSLRRGSA